MLKMSNYIGKRKHVSQMAEKEVNHLFNRLKSVEKNGKKWRITRHTLDRINQKGINASYEDMISVIHNSNLVEYKIDPHKFDNKPEERVVLSSKFVVNRNYYLKVVYSLTDNIIVTAWMNHVKDNHATLDWNLYSADMPVFGV